MSIITEVLSEMLPEAFNIPGAIMLNKAQIKIQKLYDKLCPKPSEFPEGFGWYAIEPDGEAHFIKVKPNLYDDSWIEINAGVKAHKVVELPLGLDWRLCCWSLEDAKRIDGEDV
jgi:hypothetical protein